MSRNFGDREGSKLRRPPLAVVLVAVVVIALGETGGAAMSRLKPQIERYVAARVAANPQTHGLSGSAEYDDEVRDRAVFAVEAGLSFFHTHAEGVGLIVFFASTLVAKRGSLAPRPHGALRRAHRGRAVSARVFGLRCRRAGSRARRGHRARRAVGAHAPRQRRDPRSRRARARPPPRPPAGTPGMNGESPAG